MGFTRQLDSVVGSVQAAEACKRLAACVRAVPACARIAAERGCVESLLALLRKCTRGNSALLLPVLSAAAAMACDAASRAALADNDAVGELINKLMIIRDVKVGACAYLLC